MVASCASGQKLGTSLTQFLEDGRVSEEVACEEVKGPELPSHENLATLPKLAKAWSRVDGFGEWSLQP